MFNPPKILPFDLFGVILGFGVTAEVGRYGRGERFGGMRMEGNDEKPEPVAPAVKKQKPEPAAATGKKGSSMKTAKKSAKRRSKSKAKGSGTQGGGGRRPFPGVTLLKALPVPQKIKELNGGNPWSPENIATALEVGPRSPKFYYITAAARDFGLTTGTRDSPTIALTDLGRSVVYAPDPETERAKKVEAFLSIDLFKRVLEHYKGSELPEMKYLGNTLENEFKLPPSFHEEFSRLFRENCQDLDITSGSVVAPGDQATPPAQRPTVVVGLPKGGDSKNQPKAFIIMPFVEKSDARPAGFFKEVLRSLLTPAGVASGFVVETANRQGSDVIQSTIVNDLLEADLVVADLTDHNPNVLFELGVRIAEDKPVVLVKASGTGRIFDVDNMMRVYEYSANLWQSTVEKDLAEITEHIKAAWAKRSSDQSYMKILRRGSGAKGT